MRRARVLWIGFLFQWSPFSLWMLHGTFYGGKRPIRSWTFQKCRAEPRSRTGLKVGFFRIVIWVTPLSLWRPAQYRVTAPALVLPPLTGNFCLLPVSSASQLRSSFALDLQWHLVPGVFSWSLHIPESTHKHLVMNKAGCGLVFPWGNGQEEGVPF